IPSVTNRNGCYGNSFRHLNDRKKCILTLEMPNGNRHADDGEIRIGSYHSWKVCRSTSACYDHLDSFALALLHADLATLQLFEDHGASLDVEIQIEVKVLTQWSFKNIPLSDWVKLRHLSIPPENREFFEEWWQRLSKTLSEAGKMQALRRDDHFGRILFSLSR